MKLIGTAVALWLAVSASAEDADALEKAARKDVPDAILDNNLPLGQKPGPKIENFHQQVQQIDNELQELRRALRTNALDQKGPRENADARDKIQTVLERKFSFEFADTSLDEALVFLKMLTRLEIALDASVLAADRAKTPVNLKAVDLQLDAALTRICKAADLKWEIRGSSIVLSVPAPLVAVDRAERKEEPARDEHAMPKIHAKLADGTEIEIDAPLLNMPGVGQALLDRIIDPAKDGILAFRLGRDIEPQNAEPLMKILAKSTPNCTVEVVDPGILLISSGSVGELRKALAIIRAMRPEGMRPPPPPGGERGRRPPGPPPEPRQGEQTPPKKAREEAPGQF